MKKIMYNDKFYLTQAVLDGYKYPLIMQYIN